MPPVRTSTSRASQACASCRARKTRCYESTGPSRACLRCSTLHLPCSLAGTNENDINDQYDGSSPKPTGHSCQAVEHRVSELEKTVTRLSRLLAGGGSEDEGDAPAPVDQAAPLLVIRDAVSTPVPTNAHPVDANLVDRGLLTAPQADILLRSFRRHCGRWIGADQSVDEPLQIQSSLLSCACCLVAARHSNLESSSTIATALFAEAKAIMGENLLTVSHDLEFFQSILVLSLWSTTVGQRLLSMDSWLITGMAFQHDIATRASNEAPLTHATGHRKYRLSEKAAVYAHLCLSHLHACISMRRKSMLNKIDMTRIQNLVSHVQADNYRTRMLAETLLYWTIYQECVASSVVLTRGQAALQKWRLEWAALFEQPRHHFLQIGFWFAQLLMYEQSLNNKSTAVRESLVSQMLDLCSRIMHLAMDTADERSAYLTDHIYHMITFAGVTLVRLLAKYKNQLGTSYDIEDMDQLTLTTANWLKSIGSECHIGKVSFDIIITLHRKLRPEKHSTSPWSASEQQAAGYNAVVPEFLSMHTMDVEWDAIGQDWDLFNSGQQTIFDSAAS